MFFLLRMAFWLGLVLVLLPTGKNADDDKLPNVSTGAAVSAAAAAVSDMSQFCMRQPSACQVGGEAASVISHRAQAGARKIYHLITDKKSADQTGSITRDGTADFAAKSLDTLRPADREIEWRNLPAAATVPAARPDQPTSARS
jgi:hypothetical protein